MIVRDKSFSQEYAFLNCRQTRELTSAYLDQELTGQQMLEIRAHLADCEDCAREWREICEVRRLLRSLVPRLPDSAAQRQLVARLDQEALLETGAGALAAFLLRWLPPLRWERAVPEMDLRPRGRRLASALALSSVAILAVAAPFAPSTGDAVGRAGRPVRVPGRADQRVAGAAARPADRQPAFPAAPHARCPPPPPALPAPALAQQYTQSAVQTMDAEPFRDEAVSGYVQGATLADYQSSATGAR